MNTLFYLVPVFGVIALIYTMIQSAWVSKQPAGNDRMKEIAGYIADGAMAFLKAEYKVMGGFVVIAALLLGIMGASDAHSHWTIALAFIVGAFFSALAGFLGMRIATKSNVRTAEAARTSLSKALKVSFTGGSVMGMGVAGLAVLGLGSLFIILKMVFAPTQAVDSEEMKRVIEILTGFSLGAESIALFARVGGGIYTKAADVGADLVGKVEAGIPEDDPRNPATIADNVGDNVGDVAGMGADLFGSYVATVVSIDVDASNTIYCAGTYTGSIDLDPGTGNNSYSTVTNSQDIFVVQLSTIGNAVWGKEFGGSGNAYLNTIKVDNTNAVYLGGTFSDNIDFDPGASTYSLTSLSTSYDCFISKLNASGGFLWTKQIGGANDDEYGGLDLDPANNIYSTGYFEGSCDFDPGFGNATLNSAGLYDIFMSKLDNNGNYISSHNIGSSDNDGGLAIAIKNNNIYATGVFGATVDFDPSAASNTLTALQSPNTSDLYYFKWSQCAMSYTTINATACSYTLNGQTYTSNGTYTQLFTNAVGCDSIVTLQLTGSGTPTTITATVCNNPYVLNGISYANTGTYTQVYTNVNGCDSSITLQLTAGNTTFGNTTISACDYYIANTQIIFNSGIYTDTLTNSLGCDSILTMNVTIHNSSNSSIVVNACGTYFYNGVGYNTSGVYTNYYLTTFSCDSIVDLDLTITPLPPTNITFSGCGPYISNGQAYTTSGAYTQNFITAQNCDSTIILTLNITTPDTNVTQAGSTLTSQALPPSTYQWIQCNPNPIAIIPNATSASFTPTNNGDYAVIVTLNGCSDTSDCRSMYVNTIEDNYLSTETHLYPNPTDDILHLSFQHAIPTLQVQITSISGQVLYEKNIRDANHILLPIQKLAKGIYFVQLYDGVRKTALKFTKE